MSDVSRFWSWRTLWIVLVTAVLTTTALYQWVVQPLEDEKDESVNQWIRSITWYVRTVQELGRALDRQLDESGTTRFVESRLAASGDSAALQRHRAVTRALQRTRLDGAWTLSRHLPFATEGAAEMFEDEWYVDILSHEQLENGWHTSSLIEVTTPTGQTRRLRLQADEGAWMRVAGTEYRLYLVRNRTVSSCDLYLFRRRTGESHGNTPTSPSKS
jgi:hypothetical protein